MTRANRLTKALPLIVLLLFLFCSKTVVESAKTGLRLCSTALLPTLFPYAVLSEMILRSGVGETIAARFAKPISKCLRLSNCGTCALLLGLLCGFPIGARCAETAVESGRMDQSEAERICLCTCQPSPAFLLNVVGLTLFSSRTYGVFLLLSMTAISFLSARILSYKQTKEDRDFTPQSPISNNLASLFSESIASASIGMLRTCATVLFFSCLTGAIKSLLPTCAKASPIAVILLGMLELSSGVSMASSLPSKLLAAVLVGWSGLSVHAQIFSTCREIRLHYGRFFTVKLCHAATLSLVSAIALFVNSRP